ncbi:hypothetical protein D8B45_07250 [Candidatus Gracilibacteria bacterium]|nr:MAG: hypothetical protein D8B45_07250 [Candidatus Gracilibacteria bacterium]
MKKAKTLRFLGIFLGAWGLGIGADLYRQLPFDPLTPAYGFLIFLMLLLLIGAGISLYYAQKIKKQEGAIETDEMFKKIGYTALAASFQLLMGIIVILLLVHDVSPFLEKLGARGVLMMVALIGTALMLSSSWYYTRHPDKTGL